jgi:adenosylcobyric acid synthase
MGCYLHGIFSSDGFRRAFLDGLGVASALAYETTVDETLEALADHLERSIDVDGLLKTARGRGGPVQNAAMKP